MVAVGALLLSTGVLFMHSQITPTQHYWDLFFPTMTYMGIGVGLCISTITSSATAYLPQPKFAMGSALNNTARQIGAALGVALVSSMLVAASKTGDQIRGFHHAWIFISVAVAITGVTMLALFRKPTAEQLAAAL